jgi:hypothetical protein
MRHLKTLGIAAIAAMALMASSAVSASATTLEVEGQTTNSAVTLTASLAVGTSTVFLNTNGEPTDTCTESHMHGTTQAPFTGASVGGPLTTLSFGKCTHTTDVLKTGSLSISHIAGTTTGTVTSAGAEVTIKDTVFGISIICKTGSGTDIGTLTGTSSGHATMDINAVLNCGSFSPTVKWEGSYTVTSPTGLGVSS